MLKPAIGTIQITYLVVSVLILNSCGVPQKKDPYERGIEEFLSKKLNNFSSYEPIEFELPNMLHKEFEEIPRVYELNSQADSIIKQAMKEPRSLAKDKKAQHALDSMAAIMDSIHKKFVKEPIGYSIKHSYWAKNANGTRTKYRKEFIFDMKFNVIDWVNLNPNKAR